MIYNLNPILKFLIHVFKQSSISLNSGLELPKLQSGQLPQFPQKQHSKYTTSMMIKHFNYILVPPQLSECANLQFEHVFVVQNMTSEHMHHFPLKGTFLFCFTIILEILLNKIKLRNQYPVRFYTNFYFLTSGQ